MPTPPVSLSFATARAALVDCLKKTGHKMCVLHLHPESQGKITFILQANATNREEGAEIWSNLQTVGFARRD